MVEGQWRPDSSWNYDPMLAIENAEIGGTLIALSIPGLKPLFDRFFSKVRLHRSHPPSFNVLNPSAVFASDASKNSVVVEDRALHPISNPWAAASLGMALYSGPYQTSSETTSVNLEAASEDGSVPSHPWRGVRGQAAEELKPR